MSDFKCLQSARKNDVFKLHALFNTNSHCDGFQAVLCQIKNAGCILCSESVSISRMYEDKQNV